MRKRVQIALAVLLVILAGVIAWQVLRRQEGEPVYQGKPLSSWLIATWLQSTNREWRRVYQEADEAVRQAGTNAIPTLLRMLCVRDSALKVRLMDLAQRQHVIKIKYTPAKVWNGSGRYGFSVLGTNAQSAVPALIEIANQNISQTSQYRAIQSLGFVGPPAREAVPSLLRWATNADRELRWYAIVALGEIHAEPNRAVPLLLTVLHDDPDFRVQTTAVTSLEGFGPDAKIAVPALVEFLNAHDHSPDKEYIIKTIKAIDPEAASKAGVK